MKRAFSEYPEDAPSKIQKLEESEEEHPILSTSDHLLDEDHSNIFVEEYQYEDSDSLPIGIDNSEENKEIDNFALIENLTEELYDENTSEEPSSSSTNFPTLYDEEEAYVNLNLNEAPSHPHEENNNDNNDINNNEDLNGEEDEISKIITITNNNVLSDAFSILEQNFEIDSILGQENQPGDEQQIDHVEGDLSLDPSSSLPHESFHPSSGDFDFFYDDSSKDSNQNQTQNQNNILSNLHSNLHPSPVPLYPSLYPSSHLNNINNINNNNSNNNIINNNNNGGMNNIIDEERLDWDEGGEEDLEEMMQYDYTTDHDYHNNNSSFDPNNPLGDEEDDDDDEGSDTNSDDDDEDDSDNEDDDEEEDDDENSSADELSLDKKKTILGHGHVAGNRLGVGIGGIGLAGQMDLLRYSSSSSPLSSSSSSFLHLKNNLSYHYNTANQMMGNNNNINNINNNNVGGYGGVGGMTSAYAVQRGVNGVVLPTSLLQYPARSLPLSSPLTSQVNLANVNFDEDSVSKLYGKQKTDLPMMETPKGLKIELLKHQKEALHWMVNQEKNKKSKGGILADDMGCGKTVSMIACILSNSFEGKQKNLIVVPASCLLQWEKEVLTKTDRNLIPSIYIHYGYQRAVDIQTLEDQDLVLTTYGTLSSEFNPNNRSASPLLRTHWNRVILDEAHYIKNKQTKVASACYSLDTIYRWCLTGTPIQNRLDDLYSLIFFLKYMPYANIDYWKTWIHKATTVSSNIEGGFARLRKLISKIVLRRQKKDKEIQKILNLPPKVVITEKSKFTDYEHEFYASLERSSVNEFSKLVKEGTVMSNYGNVLTLIHRLRQACNHPKLVSKHFEFKGMEEKGKGREMVCGICSDIMEEGVISSCAHCFCRSCIRDYLYRSATCPQCKCTIFYKDLSPIPQTDDNNNNNNDNGGGGGGGGGSGNNNSSTKLTMLISKINEMRKDNSRNKCVVISQWTSFLNIIRDSLDEKSIRWARIDGMMSVKKRQSSIEEFSLEAGPPVMLLSLRAAGVGLNLAMANYVFMMDLWWNPAVEYQAIDRVHRLGQKNNVKVIKFTIANTIEERILKLQEKKQAFVDGALGSVDVINHGKLTVTDLIDLFGLNERLPNNNNNNNNN